MVPARASDGTEFNPDEDQWRFRTASSSVLIDIASLRLSAEPAVVEGARKALRLMVETRNLSSALAAFRALRQLLSVVSQIRGDLLAVIDGDHVATWLLQGGARYAAQLRPLAVLWRDAGAYGLTEGAISVFDMFHSPPNTSGEAVRTWDPVAGAYRPAEDAILKAALDAAFNAGEVTLKDYVMIRLFRGVGMRPAQLAAMKVCDFDRTGSAPKLRIPLVKRRGVPARGKFMPWKPITQELADLLALHISSNVLPNVGPAAAPDLAPLFPLSQRQVPTAVTLEGHPNKDNLSAAFKAVFKRLCVISPITGKQMVVNPRRERHTVFTGLAMNGCTAEEIAANAGHLSATSCQPYVDASIDHFQRMESYVGEAFIPVADRFLGKVVRTAADKNAATDPDAVLRDRSLTAVGSCGVGGCGAVGAGVAPVACYTCRKFRAWFEAPHAELLDVLSQEQRALLEAGHATVAETLTPTIVAITDLIEAIRQRKELQNG